MNKVTFSFPSTQNEIDAIAASWRDLAELAQPASGARRLVQRTYSAVGRINSAELSFVDQNGDVVFSYRLRTGAEVNNLPTVTYHGAERDFGYGDIGALVGRQYRKDKRQFACEQ